MNAREALFIAVTAAAGCADNTVIDKVNAGLKGGEDTAHEQQHTAEEIDAIYRVCNDRVNRAVGVLIEGAGGFGNAVDDKADGVMDECLREHGLVVRIGRKIYLY